ncbi:Cro/C1-type HTH DNA-binding domain-containing protein [Paenibacillus uliginis N3/975]|uniref:Cro/C1-type HTH DNA-binding domain-containing protein n=1 Tax=Paenibacillus uliginis N3/975 TaxID=1313296 RepID=A0A1X7GHP3_9BACL|nr:helix-turn-helix transcriptional regulator [Paenibacillus uliginis]SMF69935.1 Cro/C1-type HTH DNA-binding domain-containing protein [Paenibacillus uliginis N3/975]
MKVELGRCLLNEVLKKAGMTTVDLSRKLLYKPERLSDYIDNKRVMPLKVALSIADTTDCRVEELYEIIPVKNHEN